MNYIEKIKVLWRLHEKHAFTTTEIALYFYLLEICNICQWERQFKRNNAKIEADLSISFNTLKNARNKLQQSGLITFKTTNGSPNVIYTLSKFDKVSNEVDVKVSDKVTDKVSIEVNDELNKTKLNKTKLKISPNGDTKSNSKNFENSEKTELQKKFKAFQDWIVENAPRVAQMEKPFTISEYENLRNDFDLETVTTQILKMHNWKPLLRKNMSANLTFRNWMNKNKIENE